MFASPGSSTAELTVNRSASAPTRHHGTGERVWLVLMTGLPEGFYKITMQGFYSPSSPSTSVWHGAWGLEGDEVIKVDPSKIAGIVYQQIWYK